MIYALLVLFVILAIVAFIHDDYKNDLKLAEQIYENRTTYKDCIHFYCCNCDKIFHVKKKICVK